MDKPASINAREAAYLAYVNFLKENRFIESSLEPYRKKLSPTDFRLAETIAYGTCQRAITLDYIAKTYAKKGKIAIKLAEKALLRTALYQIYFLEKLPRFAIVDESVKIAKKHFHPRFASFLNAFLRHLPEDLPPFPSLSIKYSYPEFFIEELLKHYSEHEVEKALAAMNKPAKLFARERPGFHMKEGTIEEFLSNQYYIQNPTQASLINELCEQIKPPQTILDLCASPGGKLVALHDRFPTSQLFANDINAKKLQKLEENLTKYNISASLQEGRGEDYPLNKTFDLVVIDAPCSNSGVLNKRAEARFRLNQPQLNELQDLQRKLLEHAHELTNGPIFYMTCSILKSENEEMVKGFNVIWQKSILPDETGADGGFAALIQDDKIT